MDGIGINKETIDLRYVEQLADTEQLNALAVLMKYMKKNVFDGKKTLQQAVKQTVEVLEKQGWQAICGGNMIPGNLALPRTPEIFACLNRWRSLPNGKQ